MITVKCTYSNGDTITTRFNGTFEEAERYFLGQTFNLGAVDDNVQTCVAIKLITDEADTAVADLLRRALPMLYQLGDFIGNGKLTLRRPDSLGERCDLILDIKRYLQAVEVTDEGTTTPLTEGPGD